MERERVTIEKLKYLKTFIDYLQTNDDFYKILEDYNPTKKRKVVRVFNNVISPIITELFLKGRKINVWLFLCHNLISKCLKLQDYKNATHYFIMKIPNKRELQQKHEIILLAFNLKPS